MLRHCMIFVIGTVLACRKALSAPSCSVEGSKAFYDFCNLTWVPPVPEQVVLLFLNFNFIQEVNATSFPLRERLRILSLGTQKRFPLTIGKDAFRNLPNLTELDLGGNEMMILDPDAFVGLFKVHTLLLFKNNLDESILEEDYLRDLISLEYLDIKYNRITRIRPHRIFYNMKSLAILDFKLNPIASVCEGDLNSFRGARFKMFILRSTSLYSKSPVDWATCGNPLKNIHIETLDVGGNGWDTTITEQFCRAISGSPLLDLRISSHIMGASFGFNNLPDPDDNTFVGLTNSGLLLLNISHGFIFSLKPRVFQYLHDLKMLNLNNNKINEIWKEAFLGLQNLQHLYLSDNLLGELYQYTFEGLPNVVEIDLQRNHIGVMDRDPFKSLPRLQQVDLRDNALKVIYSLPNLTFVLLGGNRLQSTRVNEIASKNTTFLHLEGNRLENLGDLYELLQIPVLKHLILRNNRFSYCYKDKDIAKDNQLIYLDLGDNMLKLIWERGLCLDVFKALSHLAVLHLNNNYLTFLPEGIFSELMSLETLNLDYNLLTSISHDAFPTSLKILKLSSNQLLYPDPQLFATLDQLDITHNTFYCNCLLSNLIIWLNHTNVTLAGSPKDMFCSGPPEFVGIPLQDLNTDDCSKDKLMETLQLSLFIFTCVGLTVFQVAVVVFTRFRGACFLCYKRLTQFLMKEHPPELDQQGYKYDAYLCYSSKDFEWVQNSLIKHLDSQYSKKNRFALCFEDRDFLPGEDHISNIRNAIWNCRKTICVVTRQFLKDGWCVEAFNFAQSRYFSDLKDVLIVVVAGSLSQYQLMRYQPIRVFLQRGQYLRWPEDHQDLEWFLSTLSHQIMKKKEIKKKSPMLELKVITVS
ncbi:toll-like receptor 5 [Python bivittatus]|uniref:Toll-like receptor 5 n=1 Tax=Python bivittatus TaxID=176946 RepID=A0A9F5IRH5_PYTBI|nr:toll-like receptor 5 [Python bivittatus]XP_025026414.1 toll-like receptor 5 [Python bivittatus]XP_025026415.1 toll-like receptor 5 [Python bivittatus]